MSKEEVFECLVADYGFLENAAARLIEKYSEELDDCISHLVAERLFNRGREEGLFDDESEWFTEEEWDLDAEET